MSAAGNHAELVRTEDMTRILPGPVPVTLVEDIDLTINGGEFVAITGPSGSGKSSLLYLLGLLDSPTEGRVMIEATDMADFDTDDLAQVRLEKIGFVFQFHFLLPEFSVLDNVLVPMRKLGRLGRREMRARARQLLADLGLETEYKKRVDQLSGGQRQRVAIARALANDPLVVLADEPTGSLDQKNGHIVFDIFTRLVSEQGRTVVTVTHEPELAGRCDRQIHLVDGRIVTDRNRVGD